MIPIEENHKWERAEVAFFVVNIQPRISVDV